MLPKGKNKTLCLECIELIKAIAFDFDHTLYDRDATYVNLYDSFTTVMKDYLKKGIPREELISILQKADREGLYAKKWAAWRGIYRRLCEYDVFTNEPGFELYYAYILEWYPKRIQAYDDTYSTINWCRENGYRTAIITNGPEDYQMKKIRKLKLDQYVDSIVVGGAIGRQKPLPEPFLATAENLDLKCSEIIYVGDDPVNDVEGSRKAGLTPVWFRSVGIWPDDLESSPYYIDKLSELPGIIQKIQTDHINTG